jgi:hypothetical protein
MSHSGWKQIVCSLGLSLALAATAFAQYGGGGTTSTSGGYTPKGGYSTGTDVAIGAAAAASVGAAYLLLRHRGTVVGCVEPSASGTKLLDEKDKNTYALVASKNVVLAPGERVSLKGKKSKDESGKPIFEAQRIVKDYGSCKQ